MEKVYVIVLNWNGWGDTIECLESVFRSDYPDYRVVVCDNGSRDDSLERIKAWAEGRLDAAVPHGNPLRSLSCPPVPKPLPLVEYDRTQAEAGGTALDGGSRLVLIRNGGNLGFAGGNNVGLRHALARGDFDYVWLLNNDTVVRPDALSQMVRRMRERPDAGICGSTLPYYHRPDRLWAQGGATYNKWLGFPRSIGLHRRTDQGVDPVRVERRMDFVAGASMLVSLPFLREIGLLCEDYFLYFEDLDWAVRARRRYSLAYAPASVVYHKVEASIGVIAAADRRKEGRISKAFNRRSKIAFTKKYCPYALPTALLGLLALEVASRLRGR